MIGLLPVEGLPKTILERVKESTFTAFSRLVERAIAEKIDFMIIAGDIFDASHRSFKSAASFYTSDASAAGREHRRVCFLW
ncbi:hypothetical protein QS257_06755 [Terrilactibacillus sp. S3-3]|nr:hypothetical protein QS257_06755 [Terrilactibacillus sp. S3-3]